MGKLCCITVALLVLVLEAKCADSIACRDPGTPEHGSRDTDSFGSGVVVTFTCDSGYTGNGAESITCENTGRWSGRRPECEPVECSAIRAPRHGSRDGDQIEYLAKVIFTCFPGYEMQGEKEVSCQANGQWSSSVPTCTACIQGYYKEASQSKCTKCPSHSNTGTVASTSKQQCTCVEGSSGPQGGPCTVVECEALSAPDHGKILSCDRKQNSECEAECDAGYILSGGDRRRRCTANGWTGRNAVCTACPPNTYKMHADSTACQPCPANTVTDPAVPAPSREACFCATGFKSLRQGTPCLDINECLVNKGGCSQACDNTEGSFTCSCTIPGYELDTDGRTCLRKKSCPVLEQRPNNGFLKCRYTEHTNGHICFIKCDEGHFFVSGNNDYITCGGDSEFEWSHRTVNKTARIPACTREFFIDIDLPVTLKYKGTAGCSPPPMSTSALQQKLTDTVNTIPKCNNKCVVHDVTLDCSGSGANSAITVGFDVTLFNPHPYEVPLSCKTSCKRDSMVSMLRDAFNVAQQLRKITETKTDLLELSGDSAPSIDVSGSLAVLQGRPQMLCDPGQVLTSTRLCVPCDRGYYLPNRDLTMCKPCPKGEYQDEQGQIRCKPCLSGSTTIGDGADHPTMCSVRAQPEIEAKPRSGSSDVTEDNAGAILDNPTLGL